MSATTKPLANVKTKQEAIGTLVPFAKDLEKESGVPFGITMAQYILESGGMPSGLAKNYNNLFGVKAGSQWKGKTVTLPTKEVVNGKTITVDAKFRVYDNLLEAFKDRAAFLQKDRYKHLFKTSDPKQWAVGLQKAGYATDPQYANKLIKIMRDYGLA